MKSWIFAMSLIPSILWGQESDSRAPLQPHIAVAAHAESKITPDRATIHIAVQTRAANAAAAASENAQIQQRVTAAIRALGIATDQISTTNYSVMPEYRHEPNRGPRVVAYRVMNTIVVEIRRVDQVGPVIDAALGAGANVISALNFYASNTETARRDALARAMATARADAEVMARAAGGLLGGLLEASVGGFRMPPPRPMMLQDVRVTAGVADTPISPGMETVAVDISTRWLFIAGPSR